MRTEYEWTIEHIDEHTDIVDVEFYDDIDDAIAAYNLGPMPDCVRIDIGLRWMIWDDVRGLEHDGHAYADADFNLPNVFTDNIDGIVHDVPKRFLAEWNKKRNQLKTDLTLQES